VIRRGVELRQRGANGKSGTDGALSRARRVGAERVFELARHLTERDREVALCLYAQQVLTTDQLTLLFFSSKRRAQDRLLFLYRNRVLDRFYPPSRFGAGKPQAHWLLDEAGAHLVAASLDLDRRGLDWSRRDDWASHPQLAHRLAVNRFATDLITATLGDATLGVMAWFGPRRAAARLGERMRGTVRPDAELLLATTAGAVDLLLEWDRGTETLDRLDEKLRRYRMAERKVDWEDDGPRSILFVVPGAGRLDNLHRLCADLDREGSWPVLATTQRELDASGPLEAIWQRLDANPRPQKLIDLPVRDGLGALSPAVALGRCWRHEAPGFWERLSPLGRTLAGEGEADLRLSETAGLMPDPVDEELDSEEVSWR
jgi:protein involved in plasmid replication-relaxation